ncbi:MAG TPA: hypothetical protein VF616_27200 [Duganella sp.]|uniref:DUF7210 family protein n=1 Tax=Duganella sp. TaxID=1904440 RepID=UPI002ED64387
MKITAIDSFAHGAHMYVAGDPVEVTKSTAEDLIKAGLVSETMAPQTGVTDSQAAEENLDDLVGGEKMEEAPQNKMAPAPANKKAR